MAAMVYVSFEKHFIMYVGSPGMEIVAPHFIGQL
jgi:hypothetical protein